MSLWSIDLLRAFALPVAGLAFRRDGFSLAVNQRKVVREVCSLRGDAPWFDERGVITGALDWRRVRAALQELPRHLPIHMALPNPAVRFFTLRSQDRTRTRNETEQLIHWHGAHLGLQAASSQVAYRWSGKRGSEHHLFALAAEKTLVEQARVAAEPHCVRRLSPAIAYLRKSIPGARHPVLIADVDEESWTLLVTDSAGNIRLTRSGWRYPEDDAGTIAGEARRLVHAAGETCEPGLISCWCAPEEWGAVEYALRHHFPAARGVRNFAQDYARFGDAARAAMAALA